IDFDCPHYVERPPVESNCTATISNAGSLLRIKAPRRMGKSWLIDRLLYQASQEDYFTIKLDLEEADHHLLVNENYDEFVRWFCLILGRKLKLENRLDDYWEDGLGSKYNCTLYLRKYFLTQVKKPLVLALDNVDLLFPYHHIAQDFFPMLRSWHEGAKTRAILGNLRLIIAHATEIYIKLKLTNSPFNVGTAIELAEFAPAQIQELGNKQGLNWNPGEINQLEEVVGGHPYLIQRAISATQQGYSLEQILERAATESGIYAHHLRSIYALLDEYSELKEKMIQVVNHEDSIALNPQDTFQLESLGLVITEGNQVKVSRRLYRDYLKARWAV
ncbi:MAG: DNA-binding protein, partial [Moorea sp. SIO2B7]|nr:DNA-binding protein [Moorena sp. SIO2B7]